MGRQPRTHRYNERRFTMSGHDRYGRMHAGSDARGVRSTPDTGIGVIVEELHTIAACSADREWENQVRHIPRLTASGRDSSRHSNLECITSAEGTGNCGCLRGHRDARRWLVPELHALWRAAAATTSGRSGGSRGSRRRSSRWARCNRVRISPTPSAQARVHRAQP